MSLQTLKLLRDPIWTDEGGKSLVWMQDPQLPGETDGQNHLQILQDS